MSLFEETYARLQGAFRTRCATESAELRRLVGDGDLDSDRVIYLLHRLAGAAGTFGFDGLSTQAAQVESSLRRGDVSVEELDDLFETLEAAAA